MEFRNSEALQLLSQAGDTVKMVNAPQTGTVIEPAALNASPVYWERAESIVGPGTPEFLAKVGDGPTVSYWVVVSYEGQPVWINSIMLRSRRQFEQQVLLKPVELVKEPR